MELISEKIIMEINADKQQILKDNYKLSIEQKLRTEDSLKMAKMFFGEMIRQKAHLNCTYASDIELWNFDKFKREVQQSLIISPDRSNLKIVYKDCWALSEECIKLYDDQVKHLPNIGADELISKVLDTPTDNFRHILIRVDSSLIIIAENEKYYIIFDFDFHGSLMRKEIYAYCVDIAEILSEIFGETLLEEIASTPAQPAKPKSLTVNGNYKQLCLLFSTLYENPQCQFNNTIQEIAIFSYVHFSYTRGNPSPSINEIVEALGGTSTDHVDQAKQIDREINLKWHGANNQLYYVFKKLHVSQIIIDYGLPLNEELFYIIGSLAKIGNFMFKRIEFKYCPQKERIIGALGCNIKVIIKKNKPDINWAEINSLK